MESFKTMFGEGKKRGKLFPKGNVVMDYTQILAVQPRDIEGQKFLRGLKAHPILKKNWGKWIPNKELITQYNLEHLIPLLDVIYKVLLAQKPGGRMHIEIVYSQGNPLRIDTEHLSFFIAPRTLEKSVKFMEWW